jgi:signal transduction histidine kinase
VGKTKPIPDGEVGSSTGVDELLAARIVAHELRQPIATIINATQILYSETTGEAGSYGCLNDFERQLLQNIKGYGFHALEIVEQVFALNDLQMGRVVLDLQNYDLRKFLVDFYAETALLFKEKPEIEYLVDLPSSLPHIRIDVAHLRQVVSNVLNNVRARQSSLKGQVVLGAYSLDSKICIYVRDTSIDIASDKGEKGSQAQGQGENSKGIGLMLVREYMQILGGEVILELDEVHGSTFRLLFPLALAS